MWRAPTGAQVKVSILCFINSRARVNGNAGSLPDIASALAHKFITIRGVKHSHHPDLVAPDHGSDGILSYDT